MNVFSTTSLVTLAAAAALAACSSPVKLNDAPVESRTPGSGSASAGTGSAAAGGAQSGSAAQSGVASVDLTRGNADANAANLGRVVYFDYDSFVIRDEFKPVIEGHARAMATNRGKRAVVEGHADERGSHEYNLALGQKRAEAVARSLELMGVTQNQVEAVSYGEERPAVQGSDESAHARNRRAELKDR